MELVVRTLFRRQSRFLSYTKEQFYTAMNPVFHYIQLDHPLIVETMQSEGFIMIRVLGLANKMEAVRIRTAIENGLHLVNHAIPYGAVIA
jgi:hypothetical protein